MNKRTITLLSAIAMCSAAFAQMPPNPGPPQGGQPDQNPGMMPPPGMPGGPPGGMQPGMPGGMPPMGMPGMGMNPGAMEQITVSYLGVEASPTDPALRAQTKLTGEVGLTINFVAPDSPAKAAGVQQYDILTKVNDQLVFNPPQLQSLIRSMKSGDEVKLSVIRQGEMKVLTAKLTEHQAPGGPTPGMGMMPMGPNMMPGGMGGMMGPMGWNDGRIQSLKISDGDTTVEVKANNGEVTVTATNKAGEALYTGPVDTKEQRAKVPDNVRSLLNDLAINDLIHRMKMGFQGPRGFGGGGVGGGYGRPGGPQGGGPPHQDHRNGPPPAGQ